MSYPELNEKYVKKLEEELSYINEDLVKISEDSPDNLPKVLEKDFVIYLLPYILNLVDKKENDKAFFNNWMNLVGDITLPFYVVDDNNNILFKVPRYLARFDEDNTPISDVSYITILKEFDAEYKRIPTKAMNDLSKVVDSLSSIVAMDKESLKELVEFYFNIRNRYKDLHKEEQNNNEEEEAEYLDIDYED